MSSTFFGLNIAASGMSAFQTSIDTTANNISNIRTEGYSRQRATAVATDPLRTFTTYGMIGSGVEIKSIEQIRDQYYDLKYWLNNQKVGEYDAKIEYMQQIESAFKDDATMIGFTSIYSEMYQAMQSLAGNPSNESFRNQYINEAETFAQYFNQTYGTLANMQEDINTVIYTEVNRINEIAQEVALLNKQIDIIELQGDQASELRDKRALLVDELSSMIPVEVNEIKDINSTLKDNCDGTNSFSIKVNGHVLVKGRHYDTINAVAREYKVNQTDIDGLYDLFWNSDSEQLAFSTNAMSGELKGLFDVRDGNNAGNFKGEIEELVTVADVNTDEYVSRVIVRNPSMQTVETLTIPEEGRIKFGNKYYNYSGFTANTKVVDGQTVIDTIEFDLTEVVPNAQSFRNKQITVGDSVDYMGIPFYQNEMSEFIRHYAESYNEIHTKGQDLYGNDAKIFFTGKNMVTGSDFAMNGTVVASYTETYYRLTAENFKVSEGIHLDAKKMATSSDITKGGDFRDILDELINMSDTKEVFKGGTVGQFLENLLSDIAIETNRAKTFSKNYTNISNVIIKQRTSISGVDEDEEAMALVQFQNSYNLAARMVQCMSEIYDRLILETGV